MELTPTLVLAKTKVDSLAMVKNLNLWGSELEDISVVRQLPSLEVLALSVNKIKSLADVGQCSALRELYLRKNAIASLAEVRNLSRLPHLSVLWLCDNPCSTHPLYRLFTIRCCPSLKQFDNVEVTAQERAEAGQMSQATIDQILAERGRAAAAPPPPPPAAPAASAPPVAEKRRSSEAVAPPAAASAPPQQAAPSSAEQRHSSRHTQKNILSAVLTLLNEMNTDTLQYLHDEVGERLKKKRSGMSQ